jgi:hypothetical protein
MKHTAGIASFLFIALGFFVSVQSAHPYSFSAWGSMTGDRTLALNPSFYGALSPFDLTTDLVFSYGFRDDVDVFVDIATLTVSPDFDYAGSWVMGRCDLGGSNIIAAQLGFVTGAGSTDWYLVPQYHFFKEGDRFAWEMNAGVEIPLTDVENSLVFGVFAPVFKAVPDTLSLFLEVNPSYQLGDSKDFILEIVPGLCMGFADNNHQISVGIPISDLTENAVDFSFAAWYWTSFSL